MPAKHLLYANPRLNSRRLHFGAGRWNNRDRFPFAAAVMNGGEILESWKDISAYLGRTVRTCQRWETELGLPVHRLDGSPRAHVFAYKDELDRWFEEKLREHALAVGSREPPRRGRYLAAAAVLAGLAAVALIIRDMRPRPSGGPGAAFPRPSLAVMTFANLTGDAELDYLRETLPADLTVALQRASSRLTVLSRVSVLEHMRERGLLGAEPLTPSDTLGLVKSTGADHFLTGEITRAGSRCVLKVSLCAAADLRVLKTETISGGEGDLLGLTGALARSILTDMGIPFQVADDSRVRCSSQANKLYEMARSAEREFVVNENEADLLRALRLYERARDADPACALAYVGLGNAYQLLFISRNAAREDFQAMTENYEKAYALEPGLPETNIGLGWASYFRRDNDQAFRYFQKAHEAAPYNVDVNYHIGAFYASLGLLDRAIEYFSRVIDAGDISQHAYWMRARALGDSGDAAAAADDVRFMVNLEPRNARLRCYYARLLLQMKRFDDAETELGMAENLTPGDLNIQFVRALLWAARGERDKALEAITPALERPVYYYELLARVYGVLGLQDKAADVLERAMETGFDETQTYLSTYPFLAAGGGYFFESIKKTPRFQGLLDRQAKVYKERQDRYGDL